MGTSASKTPRQFGTPRQAHYNGLHEFPRALLALASSVMLEVSQLHDLDGAARLAEADRRMALIPSKLPGKVSARDVKVGRWWRLNLVDARVERHPVSNV